MPATRKAGARKSSPKSGTRKQATKKRAGLRTATTPALGKRAHAKQIKERLHGAIRRTPPTVSEKEFEETTRAVLAIVAELAAETALVFGEVLGRLEAIERRLSR